MLFTMPRINKSLKRLRVKGYNVKSIFDIIANDNDTNTIVYTAPEFQPCAETFSDKYAFVGASMRPITEPMEKSDVPTVYISLGTVMNQRPDFYKNCIAAFKNSPCRIIMVIGEHIDIAVLGKIPPNIQVVRSADQMAALAVSDVFVTHCGMNSVNEALYYGVPMVLFPQTPEQSGVANRTNEVGAGLFLTDDSAETIRNAVDTVLENNDYKKAAEGLAVSFQKQGGAVAAADLIEKIAAGSSV